MTNKQQYTLDRSDANLIEVLFTTGLEENEVVEELMDEGHTEDFAKWSVALYLELTEGGITKN